MTGVGNGRRNGRTQQRPLVWDQVLGHAMELSSIGIRVDREALLRQLKLSHHEDREKLYFHQRLLNGELPPEHWWRYWTKPSLHVLSS